MKKYYACVETLTVDGSFFHCQIINGFQNIGFKYKFVFVFNSIHRFIHILPLAYAIIAHYRYGLRS